MHWKISKTLAWPKLKELRGLQAAAQKRKVNQSGNEQKQREQGNKQKADPDALAGSQENQYSISLD